MFGQVRPGFSGLNSHLPHSGIYWVEGDIWVTLGSLCVLALSINQRATLNSGTEAQLCLLIMRTNPTSYCGKTKTAGGGEPHRADLGQVPAPQLEPGVSLAWPGHLWGPNQARTAGMIGAVTYLGWHPGGLSCLAFDLCLY